MFHPHTLEFQLAFVRNPCFCSMFAPQENQPIWLPLPLVLFTVAPFRPFIRVMFVSVICKFIPSLYHLIYLFPPCSFCSSWFPHEKSGCSAPLTRKACCNRVYRLKIAVLPLSSIPAAARPYGETPCRSSRCAHQTWSFTTQRLPRWLRSG